MFKADCRGQCSSRKTYCNNLVRNSSLDQGCSSEVSEKWVDSGYIFKVVPTSFVYGLDVGYGGKRGIKNNSKVLGLSIWLNRVGFFFF